MCSIQGVFFIKNNSNLSSPCTALSTDTIKVDIIFIGNASENGIPVFGGAAIKIPNGTIIDFYSLNFSMISGSNDAYLPVDTSIYGNGVYQITNAYIKSVNSGASICTGIPSAGFCQSITISTPCINPTCNFTMV